MTVTFSLTSSTTPAPALMSRLEYLLTTGKAGVAFDTSVGFTSSAGGATFVGEVPAVQSAPTTATGGGGGGGGLSAGAIAGIVVGSVVGVAAMVAVAAAVVVAMNKKKGEVKEGQATTQSQGGKGKGVPVMNAESHQRRVIEGEMTSVTGRGGL